MVRSDSTDIEAVANGCDNGGGNTEQKISGMAADSFTQIRIALRADFIPSSLFQGTWTHPMHFLAASIKLRWLPTTYLARIIDAQRMRQIGDARARSEIAHDAMNDILEAGDRGVPWSFPTRIRQSHIHWTAVSPTNRRHLCQMQIMIPRPSKARYGKDDCVADGAKRASTSSPKRTTVDTEMKLSWMSAEFVRKQRYKGRHQYTFENCKIQRTAMPPTIGGSKLVGNSLFIIILCPAPEFPHALLEGSLLSYYDLRRSGD
ncbi:hypothetical protein NA57DRAFT_53821 [Rhizodiscina lignyota]|uniref:Uncharacterized protein n=1 Tax=Rhizodiscina lignyota TaxID=1504668 RepID=A0A9P4M991_9PEZI|nr:hypothetical protein NA57DRAFT_53821 [Rhizodiscina lignyota]